MQGKLSAWMRQNVLGLIAIFIALGGTAFAVGLARDSVKAKHIRANAVRNAEIKDNAVTGQKVAPGTLGSSDVDDGSLGGADIANGTLGGGDVADGGLDGADLADGSITGSDIGDESLTGADILDSTLSPTPDCRAGYVVGVAEIDGGATAGGGFSGTGVTGGYSCRSVTGNQVSVRRNGVGDYCVRFDGFSPSEYSSAATSISVSGNGFARVVPGDDVKCPADSYDVATRDHLVAAADRVFTIILL
jgi:hypothetical protein